MTQTAVPTGAAQPSPTTAPIATVAPTPTAVPPTSSTAPTQTAAPSSFAPPTATVEPTPAPTAIDVRPFLTSAITVVNLAEVLLSLRVSVFERESDTEHVLGSYDLQPLQVVTQSAAPARYQFEFELATGAGAPPETCMIEIADDEQVYFGVLAEGVVVSIGDELPDPAEMIVASSSRCRAGADV